MHVCNFSSFDNFTSKAITPSSLESGNVTSSGRVAIAACLHHQYHHVFLLVTSMTDLVLGWSFYGCCLLPIPNLSVPPVDKSDTSRKLMKTITLITWWQWACEPWDNVTE